MPIPEQPQHIRDMLNLWSCSSYIICLRKMCGQMMAKMSSLCPPCFLVCAVDPAKESHGWGPRQDKTFLLISVRSLLQGSCPHQCFCNVSIALLYPTSRGCQMNSNTKVSLRALLGGTRTTTKGNGRGLWPSSWGCFSMGETGAHMSLQFYS